MYYQLHQVCSECNISNRHGDKPHAVTMNTLKYICTNCGESSTFKDVPMKFVSTSKWYNPFSWFDGKWEPMQ